MNELDLLNTLETLARALYDEHGPCTIAVTESGAVVQNEHGNTVSEVDF